MVLIFSQQKCSNKEALVTTQPLEGVIFAMSMGLTKPLVFELGMWLSELLVQSITGSAWWELLML